MPSDKSLSPSKFFGGNRYAAYLDELTASGTIAGQNLTPAERKEAFKKRGDKINFEKFVNKVLQQKTGPAMSGPSKALPGGGGGGAIVKSKGSAVQPFIASPVSEKTQENLDDILKGIDSILETLRSEQKFEKQKTEKERKQKERVRRAAGEDKLEKSAFKKLGDGIKKTLKPVKSIFDEIFKFLFTTLVGRVLVKLVNWFSDEENQKKVQAIGRFLKDTWPALLAGYILFGTGLGKFVRGLVGLTIFFAKKMAMVTVKLLALAAKNPLVTAGVLTGAATLGAYMWKKGEDEKQIKREAGERGVEPSQVKSEVEKSNKGPMALFGDAFSAMGPMGYNGGGRVYGSGNRDTVPAMLTPGEFVMSRGAVSRYGANTFAAMNAMGGGTNRPSFTSGIAGFSGGGPVGMTDIQKQALGVLAKYESGAAGYNAVNQIGTKGGRGVAGFSGDIRKMPQHKGRSLTDFTIGEIKKLQYDDRKMSNQQWINAGKLHAVGRYQFIGNTLPGVARRAGIPDDAKFSPGVQDLMALQLMKERGISPWVGPSDKATSSERAIVAQARRQPIKYDPKITMGSVATASSGKAWWDPLGLFTGKDESSVASAPTESMTSGVTGSFSSASPRAEISPPSGPPVSFEDALAALSSLSNTPRQSATASSAGTGIPFFDAALNVSDMKAETLGILRG